MAIKEKASKFLQGKSSTLTGVIIGIIIGTLFSLGVAWYITNTNNAFQEKQASVEVPAPSEPLPLPGKPGDAPISNIPNANAGNSPESAPAGGKKYDFYKLLPGEAPPPAATPPAQSTAPPKPTAPAPAPSPSPSPSARPNTDLIYLQAGAFEDQSKADALRATLALSQMESRIKADQVPGKGLLYKVRLGPYDNATAATVRRQLEAQGLRPSVVHE